MRRDEKATRAGIVASMVGVVVAAVAPFQSIVRLLGGVLVVVGWLVSAWALHRYGRAADED